MMVYFNVCEKEREEYDITLPNGIYLEVKEVYYGDLIDGWMMSTLFDVEEEVPSYMCYTIKDIDSVELNELKHAYCELLKIKERHECFTKEFIALSAIHDYSNNEFSDTVNLWNDEIKNKINEHETKIRETINALKIKELYQVVKRDGQATCMYTDLENAKNMIVEDALRIPCSPFGKKEINTPNEFAVRAELNSTMRYKDAKISKIEIDI